MKLRKGDFIVVTVVIAVAALIWAYPFLRGFTAGDSAVVMREGEKLYELSLNRATVIELEDARIVVADGAVRISESSCPDKVCVNTGSISRAGQSIVCVPNRIIIKIPYSEDSATDIIVS